MRNVRRPLSYGNVTATLALFVALGGTSYAVVALPRNSVGPAQLRAKSVGASEIRRQAVGSSELKDEAIRLRDISDRAKDALQGQVGPAGPQGPPGPTFAVTINSAGGVVRGSPAGTAGAGVGALLVQFSRSVSSCVPTATLTAVAGGPTPTPPSTAHVRAAARTDGRVLVETWNENGVAAAYPFNLVVAC